MTREYKYSLTIYLSSMLQHVRFLILFQNHHQDFKALFQDGCKLCHFSKGICVLIYVL